MKTKTYLTTVLLIATPLFISSCGDRHEHDHDDHDHGHEHADHGHAHEEPGHVHAENVSAGPNGGHVVKSQAGFSFEVAVDQARKARISMLDSDGKVTAAGDVTISGIAGERSNPVKLSFAKGEGDDAEVLISDNPMPEGAHVPVVLTIQTGPDAEAVTERFELHLH